MRQFHAVVLTICTTICIPSAVVAKDDNGSVSKNAATDKKRLLIDQITETIKEEKPTEEECAALKKKSQERLERMIDVIADKTNMSPEEKQKLKEKLRSNQEKQAQQSLPPEVKAQIESKLAIKDFCKDMGYQVLGDHLEESDLK